MGEHTTSRAGDQTSRAVARDRMHDRVEWDLTNHPPSRPLVGTLMDEATDHFKDLAHWLVDHVPAGRELSTALTKLEEVSMHAKAGIARNQADV